MNAFACASVRARVIIQDISLSLTKEKLPLKNSIKEEYEGDFDRLLYFVCLFVYAITT